MARQLLLIESMFSDKIQSLTVAALVATAAASTSGCYDPEGPPPGYAEGAPPGYADGYQPQFYEGYVVYYDESGQPFYHLDGVPTWVPPGSPFYGGLVGHWRAYGSAYRRWYGHGGYGYRGYHRR